MKCRSFLQLIGTIILHFGIPQHLDSLIILRDDDHRELKACLFVFYFPFERSLERLVDEPLLSLYQRNFMTRYAVDFSCTVFIHSFLCFSMGGFEGLKCTLHMLVSCSHVEITPLSSASREPLITRPLLAAFIQREFLKLNPSNTDNYSLTPRRDPHHLKLLTT